MEFRFEAHAKITRIRKRDVIFLHIKEKEVSSKIRIKKASKKKKYIPIPKRNKIKIRKRKGLTQPGFRSSNIIDYTSSMQEPTVQINTQITDPTVRTGSLKH